MEEVSIIMFFITYIFIIYLFDATKLCNFFIILIKLKML